MTCIKACAATGRYQQRALATALTMVMEDIMGRILIFAAALALMGQLTAGPSQAGSASLLLGATTPSAQGSLTQPVRWRSCEFWRDRCAWRWGPGTWRFARCMWRHGC